MTGSEAIKLIETDLIKLYKFDTAMTVYAKRLRKQMNDRTKQIVAQLTDQGRLIRPGPQMVQMMSQLERALIDIVGGDEARIYLRDISKILTKRALEMDRLVKKLGLPDEALIGPDITRNSRYLNALERVSDSMSRSNAVSTQKIAQTIQRYKTLANTSDAVPYRKFLSELQVATGIPARYTGTVANTSLMSMDREMRQDQATRAGIEKAKYVGPRDMITREFCATHLDQVQSWAYWQSTTNQVGPNTPSQYCGGWNCRHALVPWLDEWSTSTGKVSKVEQKPDAPAPAQAVEQKIGEALTREKAIEQTRSLYESQGLNVSKVNIDASLTLDQINQRNKQISSLLSEYKTGERLLSEPIQISMQGTDKSLGFVNPYRGRMEINFGHSHDHRRATRREDITGLWQMPKAIVDADKLEISTLTHEFAHSMGISYKYVRAYNRTELDFFDEMTALKSKYNRELNKLKKAGDTRGMIDIYLGDYSKKNVDEFFAEAFTEAKLKTNPSKYAKLVLELVNKYFKK
jgi:hypothetical protein